ncbi:outer membrane protein [Pyruvatibacter mobilis]|uniref:outer membrane protein n=1 Tax=Pyruvatibacter mobilis TaxID=1712261 RepID=UPI003BAAE750
MLKSKLAAATAAVALVMGAPAAFAEEGANDGGFYVSAGGGINWISDMKNNGLTLDLESGATYAASVGYDFGENASGGAFRVEAEYSRTKNDLGSISNGVTSVSLSGDLTQNLYMVHLIYDFWANDTFTPYVGVGAGVADIEVSATAAGVTSTGSNTEEAYRGLVGVTADVSENFALDLGFRFTSVETPESTENSAIVGKVRFTF